MNFKYRVGEQYKDIFLGYEFMDVIKFMQIILYIITDKLLIEITSERIIITFDQYETGVHFFE